MGREDLERLVGTSCLHPALDIQVALGIVFVQARLHRKAGPGWTDCDDNRAILNCTPGPYQPFILSDRAAVQLHRTGHSLRPRDLRVAEVGSADFAAIELE